MRNFMVGLFTYPKRRLRKLLKDGEYAEAIKYGIDLEPKFSDDHDFMFIMGSAFLLVEEAQKALPYFEKAYSLDKNDIENLTLKTNAHLAIGQKQEAIICCKEIISLAPNNMEAKNLLDELQSL